MKGSLIELAPLDGDDYDLLASWSGSDIAAYSAGGPEFLTGSQLRAVLERHPASYLMVRSLADGTTIGAVNWQTLGHSRSYSFGITIGDTTLWGGGYGMDAIFVLLEYFFHARNAHRVHFQGGAYNKQVMQLYTSGMITIEGILRDYYFIDGEYHDAVVGSVLRDEYYAMAAVIGGPRTAVPDADKREARALLEAYIDKNPIASRRDRGPRISAPTANGAVRP